MVDYSMFLEDCDLLEAIEIEKTISENCEDLLDEYISESEMLIDIYETQRFMVEQDTEIFITLKYDYIEDSVLSKVWNGILEILKRIRGIIVKFVNFIREKRKANSNTQNRIINKDEKVLKPIILPKYTNTVLNDTKAIEKYLSETIDTIIDLCNNIETLDSEEIYMTIDVIDDILSEDELRKFKTDTNDIVFGDLCDYDTYISMKKKGKFDTTLKVFDNKYESISEATIKSLESFNKNKVNSLEQKIKQLSKKYTDENKIREQNVIKHIQKSVTTISSLIVNRINFLYKIEQAYSVHQKNLSIIEDIENPNVNDKYITPEFKQAVEQRKKTRIRIMLKDSLLIDKTFKQFDSISKYAMKYIDDLYDEHEGDLPSNDKSKWTEDVMNEEMVNVVNNFSRERIAFLKRIVTHLYKK